MTAEKSPDGAVGILRLFFLVQATLVGEASSGTVRRAWFDEAILFRIGELVSDRRALAPLSEVR